MVDRHGSWRRGAPFRAARAWAAARSLATMGAVCAVMLIAFAPPGVAHGRACPNARTAIARASRRALQGSVACLVNQQRHARGLPALQVSEQLNRSAQGWTDVMAGEQFFSHGTNFAARITAAGFDWSDIGEDIATGFATPAAVVSAWMASAGHCQNILSPIYRYVGTGVSDRGIGRSIPAGTWTQDFGLRMGQSPASGNWGPADGCPH